METGILMTDLPQLLSDDASRKWQLFCDAADNETIDLLKEKNISDQVPGIFAFSEFVAENCIRTPGLLGELAASGDLGRSYAADEYPNRVRGALSGTSDDTAVGEALCRVRRREMIRIAWRDLSRTATLSETLEDLSAFADACLQGALAAVNEQMIAAFGTPTSKSGIPQQLVVIGMGKLGARELNFSSDVDLVFTYPEPGATRGGDRELTNEEFFVRLCRRYIAILGRTSTEGPLFRVDLRLRPFGENGPLMMTFDNMEDYYQNQGRDWERYAWIKARVVAGDTEAGSRLLMRMRPFIYRRYIDYNMFESFRDMKRKIERELKVRGILENIKNGPGGIREVEFFGQIFQLLRGGVTASLQKRPIREVLAVLTRENHISQEIAGGMAAAYEFLRNAENRLQQYRDQQTHVLPTGDGDRLRLAVSMGFDGWANFLEALNAHRGFIHDQFRQILSMEDDRAADSNGDTSGEDISARLETIWLEGAASDTARDFLAGLECESPAEVLSALDALRQDGATLALGQEGRRRLNKLIPILLHKYSRTNHPAGVFQAVLDLIKAVQRRTTYLSLLLENPDAITRLFELSAASPWVISYLARHPVLLDELLDPRTLFTPPTRTELGDDLACRFDNLHGDDLEYQMETLRVFKHTNTLRVAAADISGGLPLMKVSDHLSWIAEKVIDKVLDLSWLHLTQKHGTPVCELSGETLQRGFAVIAYGKLGGFELGYTSDLDLVFLHAGTRAETVGGNAPMDTGQFFSRLAQRVLHLMTAHTAAGILYDTDMRLRPSGSDGVLVSHIDAFESYQMNEAWTWEHQALVRARAIWGDPALRDRFEKIRAKVICRDRKKKPLQKEVARMRAMMFKEHSRKNREGFDLKQDRGGMVDIEFLVQYIVLLMARRFPELARWTDNVRLIQSLAQCDLISDRTAHVLRTAYLRYRSLAHRMGLQDKPARAPAEPFGTMRGSIIDLWRRSFGST
jgi:glutamate-ammonia-ligase adenylyltransferase